MSPIDDDALDRLADFTAGTLDPDEAARVRVLIDTDPAWADAYAGLTAAGPRLDALLSGLADPPLPADVAASLSAAIGSAAIEREPRTATVVPISTHRRWARRSAWAGAVAAAVVAVFAGVLQFTTTASNTMSSGSAGSAVAPMSGSGADRLAPGPLTVLHSGRNYTPSTLGSVATGTLDAAPPEVTGSRKAPAVPAPTANANLDTGTGSDTDRLLDPASLSACLAAIVGRYGGTPVVADYAAFEGAPALVVVLDEGPGARRVVVAGPGCGVSGRGPDERYTVVE